MVQPASLRFVTEASIGSVAPVKWATNTAYALGQLVITPDNEVASAISAHTSTTVYDATKWNLSSMTSMVAAAIDAADTVTRINYATTPQGHEGWWSYSPTFDPTGGKDPGTSARLWTKTGTGRYHPYGRGAGTINVRNTPVGQEEFDLAYVKVSPGEGVGAGMWMKSNFSIASPNGAILTIRWYTSAGVSISTVSGTEQAVTANTWKWYNVYGVAPANAAYMWIENVVDTGSDTIYFTGGKTWGTNVLIEKRSNAPASTDYFDGNSSVVNGNKIRSWTGRPYYSASKEAISSLVAKRSATGTLSVNTPAGSWEATPKNYVDMASRAGKGFINVKSDKYEVRGDGVYDDTHALQAALNDCGNTGGGIVYIPAGTYIHTGLFIPSNVHLWGAGIDVTILLMKSGTAWNNRGITNNDHLNGNTNWGVYELTVDGNQPNRPSTGGTGGTWGTNVSVIHSEYVWLTKVKSIRAMQHNFDVAAYEVGGGYLYNGGTNGGDGIYAPQNPDASGVWSSRPSRFVWLSHCIGHGHGDDAFTTHGSEFIWFDHCWAGTTWWANLTSYTNANGFEIDDGSRHVWLSHCYSEKNAHGFEVKAHGNVPAAFDVHLDNCVSYMDEISFSFRHIGHHISPEPLSMSAKYVTLMNCTSLYPSRVFFGTNTSDPDAANEGNTLRSLSIGAYRGVNIVGFTAIGDPNYNYADNSAVVFEYFCEDIVFTNFHIEGFAKSTQYDIYAKGGSQAAKNITIRDGIIRDSAKNGMSIGSAANLQMSGVSLSRNVDNGIANGFGGAFYGAHRINGNRIGGFFPNFKVSDILYDLFEDPIPANQPYVP